MPLPPSPRSGHETPERLIAQRKHDTTPRTLRGEGLNWNFVVAQQPGNQPDVKRDGPLPSEQLTDLVKLLPVDENALEFDAPGDRKAKLKSQLDELKPKFEAIVRASDEPLPALRLGKLLKEA